jgi:hypothetical protein
MPGTFMYKFIKIPKVDFWGIEGFFLIQNLVSTELSFLTISLFLPLHISFCTKTTFSFNGMMKTN